MTPPTTLLPDEARRALANVRLRPHVLANGRMTGIHPSSHLGQSLEFADLKGYSFGDDFRGVDFKVYARTDKIYVRRYMDESNLTAHLILDASGSMAYPTPINKMTYAASLLACLAYVLLRQGDEVGLRIAHARRPVTCPPRGTPSHLGEILAILGAVRPSHGDALEKAIEATLVEAKRRGLVIVASDLLIEQASDLLRAMVVRGHAVVVLHVLSVEEKTFPFKGPVVFQSLESGETALLDARGLRRHYLAAFEEFLEKTRTTCHQSGVYYFLVDMNAPPHSCITRMIDDMQVRHISR